MQQHVPSEMGPQSARFTSSRQSLIRPSPVRNNVPNQTATNTGQNRMLNPEGQRQRTPASGTQSQWRPPNFGNIVQNRPVVRHPNHTVQTTPVGPRSASYVRTSLSHYWFEWSKA